jgi:hypothetical protein
MTLVASRMHGNHARAQFPLIQTRLEFGKKIFRTGGSNPDHAGTGSRIVRPRILRAAYDSHYTSSDGNVSTEKDEELSILAVFVGCFQLRLKNEGGLTVGLWGVRRRGPSCCKHEVYPKQAWEAIPRGIFSKQRRDLNSKSCSAINFITIQCHHRSHSSMSLKRPPPTGPRCTIDLIIRSKPLQIFQPRSAQAVHFAAVVQFSPPSAMVPRRMNAGLGNLQCTCEVLDHKKLAPYSSRLMPGVRSRLIVRSHIHLLDSRTTIRTSLTH